MFSWNWYSLIRNLNNLHNDLLLLPERIKIKKFVKLVPNLFIKSEYVQTMG